jgi:uncharacterized phage-associated protein
MKLAHIAFPLSSLWDVGLRCRRLWETCGQHVDKQVRGNHSDWGETMTTAFDVAGSLLSKAPGDSLNTLKLQKLVFYSFGWYAHLTGEKLFHEQFYAMEYGPVVSPLLSAHYGRRRVSKALLEDRQESTLEVTNPYEAEILDAVWSSYGSSSEHDLVEMTHCEKPWDVAWNVNRPAYARRSDLDADDIVRHFRGKRSATYSFEGRTVNVPVLALLPDRRSTVFSDNLLREMGDDTSEVPAAHAARVREARRKFLIVV